MVVVNSVKSSVTNVSDYSLVALSNISINESMLPFVCYTVVYTVRVGVRVGLGLV